MKQLTCLLFVLSTARELHSLELMMLNQQLEGFGALNEAAQREKLMREWHEIGFRDALNQCSLKPRGIWNTEGTCFLNADLQLWRAIFCVDNVWQGIDFPREQAYFTLDSGERISTEDNQNMTGYLMFEYFRSFLFYYGTISEQYMEDKLQLIQKSLEQIMPNLKASCGRAGRTHIVMQIFLGCFMKHQSVIDCTIFKSSQFESRVGMVLNKESCKKKFNESIDSFRKNQSSSELIKKSLKSLDESQNNQAYIAIEIARAVGFDVFTGTENFSWPKVLIISTTKWNPIRQTYIKITEQDASPVSYDPTKSIALIKSHTPRAEHVKFLVDLRLSQYGFPQITPNYSLIGFSAKLPGHSVAIVKHGSQWFYCSNSKAIEIPGGDKKIEAAGNNGHLEFEDFKQQQNIVPEILIYERQS